MKRLSEQHRDAQRILVEHKGSFDFMRDLNLLHQNHRIASMLTGRSFEIDMLFESKSTNGLVIVELKLGERDITDTTRGRGETVIEQILGYRRALAEALADLDPDLPIGCLLVAHRIPSDFRARAESAGIWCESVSIQSMIRAVLDCGNPDHTHPRFEIDEQGDFQSEDGRVWSSQFEDLNLPLVNGRKMPFSLSADRNAVFNRIQAVPGLTRAEIMVWAKTNGISTGAANIVLRAKERVKYDQELLDTEGRYRVVWP